MKTCYKMGNNVTAAHFARAILDLEPTGVFANKPEELAKFRKYYQAFQQKGTNSHKLQFNPQDTVAIANLMESGYLCAGSLTLLEDGRAMATVKCPLCNSIFAKTFAGKMCECCQLCKLGEDTMGLNIMLDVPKDKEEKSNNATNDDFLF